MFDPEAFGAAMADLIEEAVAPLHKRIAELEKAAVITKSMSEPKDGKDGAPGEKGERGDKGEKGDPGMDGKDGKDGKDGADGKDGMPGDKGEQGTKGSDGLGLAGAMIDRDGCLQITMTNGEVKNLGAVVGKDGADGLSLDGFELEYLPESHEIAMKATAAGRIKEVRYPAGGIRPAGYWRDGTKAQAGEAWVHDGSLWIALKGTVSKPATGDDAWIIGARKGRDGERGVKGIDGAPPAPIKLKA